MDIKSLFLDQSFDDDTFYVKERDNSSVVTLGETGNTLDFTGSVPTIRATTGNVPDPAPIVDDSITLSANLAVEDSTGNSAHQ